MMDIKVAKRERLWCWFLARCLPLLRVKRALVAYCVGSWFSAPSTTTDRRAHKSPPPAKSSPVLPSHLATECGTPCSSVFGYSVCVYGCTSHLLNRALMVGIREGYMVGEVTVKKGVVRSGGEFEGRDTWWCCVLLACYSLLIMQLPAFTSEFFSPIISEMLLIERASQ